MKVIHTIPAISEEAAGPSYSVPRLCDALIRAGVSITLAALQDSQQHPGVPYLKAFPLGFGPKRLGVSPAMKQWLKAEIAANHVDIIHNHSLWMMPNVYPGQVSRKSSVKFIVSPRGTLSQYALKRSALQKKLFWHLFQGPALRVAACFHATSFGEYHDVRAQGFTQPVYILPNGIDVPPVKMKHIEKRKKLLFLGRIHPIKGIDSLLRAWRFVEDKFPEWDLEIVGPDNGGYLAKMKTIANDLSLKRVGFSGPVYGNQKTLVYQRANLFVLPTHSENFGIAVAEALASATPVITTKGAPWEGLTKHGAGWWIDIGIEPLVACLEHALATPTTQLIEMGYAGRNWMLSEYSWEKIGVKTLAVYQWLIQGGVPPSCVKFD